MTKQEFLEGLRDALLAEGADALVQENLNYYSSYIDGETAKGRTEEDVISELGGPALIANSILEAAGYVVDGVPDTNPGGDARAAEQNSGTYTDPDETGADRSGSGTSSGTAENGNGVHVWHTGGWGLLIAVLLIVFLVVTVFLWLVVGVFTVFSPILVPILIILLIAKMFQGGPFL